MRQIISDHWKRYLRSSGITFLAGFGVAILPELDNLSAGSVGWSALWGVFFAGVRGGLKLLVETFLAWYNKK